MEDGHCLLEGGDGRGEREGVGGSRMLMLGGETSAVQSRLGELRWVWVDL